MILVSNLVFLASEELETGAKARGSVLASDCDLELLAIIPQRRSKEKAHLPAVNTSGLFYLSARTINNTRRWAVEDILRSTRAGKALEAALGHYHSRETAHR